MTKPCYCSTCGGEFGEDILLDGEHICPFGEDEPGWCDICGAELTATGRCDNDHDDSPREIPTEDDHLYDFDAERP